MNINNYKKVLDHIKKNPETWDQTLWHCGTQHCFFGWAQILSWEMANMDTVRTDARVFLDLNQKEADYIADSNRSIKDFENFLDFYKENPTGYANNGYDYFGYDHEGYDRYGYNRDDYDRDGYDHDGYDYQGYDSKGYNCDGYDREGYDRFGYNRNGYNRRGYNREGYDFDDLDCNNKRRQ